MNTHDPAAPPELDAEQTAALLTTLQDLAVLVVDRDLRYVAAGGSGLRQVGWDPDELIGRAVHDVVPEPEASQLAAQYRAGLAGEAQTFRHRGIRSPETTHEVNIVPVPESDGTVQRVLVVARDVSEQIRADEAVRRSEQRLLELTASSPDMLALYSATGDYLEVSGSVQELFGWEPAELVGTSSYDYFHPDDIAAIQATHDAVMDGPDPGTVTYRLRCKDGSYRWVEVIGRSLFDEQGAVRAIQCTTRDISRRHAAEQALQEANAALAASNRELERLAAVASHDLRSPLATTRGLLDLIPDRLGTDHDPLVEELLDRARAQLQRLTETTDALLDMARLGVQELHVERVTVAELLADVLDVIGSDLAAADVQVHLDADRVIAGDRRLLRLLLQNLLSNTTRAARTLRPVRVHITARDRGRTGGWTLEVRDDGDGIPEPLRETLLESSVGVHRDRTSPGLGFGLVTCQRIAQRHGGRLRVAHLDPGTAFTVDVPRAPTSDRAG